MRIAGRSSIHRFRSIFQLLACPFSCLLSSRKVSVFAPSSHLCLLRAPLLCLFPWVVWSTWRLVRVNYIEGRKSKQVFTVWIIWVQQIIFWVNDEKLSRLRFHSFGNFFWLSLVWFFLIWVILGTIVVRKRVLILGNLAAFICQILCQTWQKTWRFLLICGDSLSTSRLLVLIILTLLKTTGMSARRGSLGKLGGLRGVWRWWWLFGVIWRIIR